jgi:Zn finger protein HypA/HybF involved in hydrogenase expression
VKEKPYAFCQNCSYSWNWTKDTDYAEKCPECGSRDVTHHTEEEILNG